MIVKNITRRDLLAAMAAGLVLPSPAVAASDLRAAPTTAQLTPPGGPVTPVWAYDGTIPGPELRLKAGQRVTRTFANDLPQASSIHWHGIRIENAMDGVAYMTQQPVPPGGRFTYGFVVPDAGTYWYHPHNRTWEQMARGLYGPLIVEETVSPDVDHDLVLMLDDWRLAQDGSLHDSFGHMRDWSHAGRLGNWVTVNGDPEWTHNVRAGQRLRLRLINAANARIFDLGLQGMDAWVVALDGQPLEEPERAGRLSLAPAQRIDLIADAGSEEGLLYSIERGEGYVVASFPASGTAGTVRAAPAPLPPNDLPALGDLGNAVRAELVMEGGAMGRMRGAIYQGKQLEVRELVDNGMAWSFNGVADLPKTPLLRAQRNQTVRIRMTNGSRWPHAMHLHGHHFRELRRGTPGPWRDTILMQPDATHEIAFVADNLGKWLLHCHMLEHAASGMMTWLEVT